MNKWTIIYFLFFLMLLLFTFKSLVFNLSTNLPDWLDYSTLNWIISQEVFKIIHLQFANFFDTNAFYPHKNTLFFSDIHLPQALLMTPFVYLTKNIILSFNVLYLTTFVLNYISLFVLWRQLFKNSLIAFTGSIFFIFSPYFHLYSAHFQMLSYWPFIFALFFLLRKEDAWKITDILIVGFLLAVQFLAGVYLAVFLIFTLLSYFVLRLATHSNKRILMLKSLLGIFVVFFIVDGIFIKGYLDTKNFYHIQRDLKEFIIYSAQPSDFLFTTNINSLIHQSFVIRRWNAFDHHIWMERTLFPGFLLLFLSLFGLFKFAKTKKDFTLSLPQEFNHLFFAALLISGYLLSFGPRISFNGSYSYIPTPYALILKLVPFMDAVRAPARWSFLFYLAIIYFALKFLSHLREKKYFNYLLLVIILLFTLEYLPLNIQTHSEQYINSSYQTLKNLCTVNKKALLEIPVTHLNVYPGIGEGVNYISKVELSSIYHECYLVNGYSGYDLPSIFALSTDLDQFVKNNNSTGFLKELRNSQVDVVKFNYAQITPELRSKSLNMFNEISTSSGVRKLDDQMLLLSNN